MTTATTSDTARLTLGDQDYDLPVTVGSEGETAIDIQALRGASGAITLDPGYGNTGSCRSAITFINGEQGILRYRGYPIGQDRRAGPLPRGVLAAQSTGSSPRRRSSTRSARTSRFTRSCTRT